MLRGLEIRDMLIIDRLDLQFEPGLNTLTGETGAGKSILLDSLGFVLGWRGRAELVRSGAERGEVVAWFDLPAGHAARAVLDEAGLPVRDELILRRINMPDGRKTAWVNDTRTSGEILRRLSDTLVELHGQQDDRGLLDIRTHRAVLDAYAGLEAQLADIGTLWTAVAQARKALSAAEAGIAGVRAEEDFLRHAVAELDALSPDPGEEAELDARRRLMRAAEKIREDVARAGQALGREGAEGAASDALRWLEGVAGQTDGRLDAALGALARALVELDEAGREVEDCLDALSFDSHALEETEERLFAIRGLARKHGVAPDELPAFADDLRARLAQLDAGEAGLDGLRAALHSAEADYDRAAKSLSAARRAGAVALDAAVMAELAPLKMERACFVTEIADETPGPMGRDRVVFTVATNPGAPAGALQKIASGGELSRFLLALKVCLAGGVPGLTMIFDEIDRGVGGATADAVGRRLAHLAGQGQVLVVTHSPQVAARAQHHWRVAKRVVDGQTLSAVTPLGTAERIEEIARMISGDRITPEARSAAEALLAG